MKSNTKYTALEVLTEAGYKEAESIFGKVRVIIGGISGIVRPDYVLNFPVGTTQIDIVVGNTIKKVEISEGEDEPEMSELAKRIKEIEGEQVTQQAEKLNKVKEEAYNTAKRIVEESKDINDLVDEYKIDVSPMEGEPKDKLAGFIQQSIATQLIAQLLNE